MEMQQRIVVVFGQCLCEKDCRPRKSKKGRWGSEPLRPGTAPLSDSCSDNIQLSITWSSLKIGEMGFSSDEAQQSSVSFRRVKKMGHLVMANSNYIYRGLNLSNRVTDHIQQQEKGLWSQIVYETRPCQKAQIASNKIARLQMPEGSTANSIQTSRRDKNQPAKLLRISASSGSFVKPMLELALENNMNGVMVHLQCSRQLSIRSFPFSAVRYSSINPPAWFSGMEVDFDFGRRRMISKDGDGTGVVLKCSAFDSRRHLMSFTVTSPRRRNWQFSEEFSW